MCSEEERKEVLRLGDSIICAVSVSPLVDWFLALVGLKFSLLSLAPSNLTISCLKIVGLKLSSIKSVILQLVVLRWG